MDIEQYRTWAKDNVGKMLTSNGVNTWKMVWAAQAGEICDRAFEVTYQMKNQETGEVLTQLLFLPKGG